MGRRHVAHAVSEVGVQEALYWPTPHVVLEQGRHSLERKGVKKVSSTHRKGQSSCWSAPPVKYALSMGVQEAVHPPTSSNPPQGALYVPFSMHTPVGQGTQAWDAYPFMHEYTHWDRLPPDPSGGLLTHMKLLTCPTEQHTMIVSKPLRTNCLCQGLFL